MSQKNMKLRDWIPIDKLDWKILSINENAIHILEKNLDKVSWRWLSTNPNAIHMLERNLDKVDWVFLSSNPNAIHMLERNLDKLSWDMLSGNPNAIHILEKHIDQINWEKLSKNSNIFTYDYNAMRMNMYKPDGMGQEFAEKMFHPRNWYKWKDWGWQVPDYDNDEYV